MKGYISITIKLDESGKRKLERFKKKREERLKQLVQDYHDGKLF